MWRAPLEETFGGVLWRSPLEVSFGGVLWRSPLAESFGFLKDEGMIWDTLRNRLPEEEMSELRSVVYECRPY